MAKRVADRATLFVLWCQLYKKKRRVFEGEWDGEGQDMVAWSHIESVLDVLNDEALEQERTDDTVSS